MVTIQPLSTFDPTVYQSIMSGYVSHEKFEVTWEDTPESCRFELQLVPLQAPYIKHFELEEDTYYEDILKAGLSLGAYDGDQMVGLALADVQNWNQAFWVHEFHVLEPYRGQGIGAHLMAELIKMTRSTHTRTMVCETQNTNVPAIRFYRRMGFRIEAVDISLYTNHDLNDGEIALFMKRHTET